ncbi:MAG TPA: ATP-binding protein [Puia sp.]|nr:ATP-binding protein [Puia sp.]
MSIFKKKRLVIASAVYWFLLVYILAALVLWFFELQHQSQLMTNYQLQELKHDEAGYFNRVNEIMEEKHRKTIQYVGEGTVFLLVILVGAIFLYRAVRRQIKLQQQQENFMMAITHELKTPIAVTKLNLETLQKYKLEEPKQQKIIQSAIRETDRLNTMANNILVSAQLEGGRYQMSKDDLDLSALTTSTVIDFRTRFPEIHWALQIEPDLAVHGDMLLLQIMINNLIENAIKYSPRDGTISVLLKKENKHAILQVRDEGPGIPGHEKKKVFQKFYRIGNEQTRTTQGTGLGLFLCRQIAADHKAHIAVSDNVPVGANFTVIF